MKGPTTRLTRWALHAALGALAAFSLLPLLWMVSASFMPAGAASTYPPPWWPSAPTLEHYRHLWEIGRAHV